MVQPKTTIHTHQNLMEDNVGMNPKRLENFFFFLPLDGLSFDGIATQDCLTLPSLNKYQHVSNSQSQSACPLRYAIWPLEETNNFIPEIRNGYISINWNYCAGDVQLNEY